MKQRIGIIGTGWVGSSIAISSLHTGVATELILSDRRNEVAEGEAMDLAHGAPFYPAATIRTGGIDDMRHCAAVVIAAGRGGRPGETRLDLLRENAAVIGSIGESLRGYTGIIVVVTNPVDVLTHVMTRASGLPPSRVIGTGTMLDTARLRQRLGTELSVDSRSVHAQVVGEHGDSEVVLWSTARVGGTELRAWPGWTADRESEIAGEVRRAAYEIIKRKGATNHAIGLVTATLLRWLLRNERRVVTISRVQEDVLGVADVALSLPAVLSGEGADQILMPPLDDREHATLQRSAEVIRSAIDSISR